MTLLGYATAIEDQLKAGSHAQPTEREIEIVRKADDMGVSQQGCLDVILNDRAAMQREAV